MPAPRGSTGTGTGWMVQMRGFAAGTALNHGVPPQAGLDTIHTQAQPHLLAPKTDAALKSLRAYSLLCGGMHGHQPQGAGNAAAPCIHRSLGYSRGAGERERDHCPCPAAGDRGCVQHAQAKRGVGSMGQSLGLAALPQLPPVMVWWERVGSPDPLPPPWDWSRVPGGSGSRRTGTAGLQGCVQPVQPQQEYISPRFWELHARWWRR